ncbi:hypothetical protein SUGI_1228470 [Cryptomeria japonica]|uniref:Uncharacterized protein n=1 Tax=Cryptomeria japonica TaxID=3369 RepID=A0AAD3RPH6_CRYJA|nr:hypothetical protein SUGI_1228470 [Cryptomeria japonica]
MHQAILDPLLMALDQLLKLLFQLAQMLLLGGPGMDMHLRLELYMLLFTPFIPALLPPALLLPMWGKQLDIDLLHLDLQLIHQLPVGAGCVQSLVWPRLSPGPLPSSPNQRQQRVREQRQHNAAKQNSSRVRFPSLLMAKQRLSIYRRWGTNHERQARPRAFIPFSRIVAEHIQSREIGLDKQPIGLGYAAIDRAFASCASYAALVSAFAAGEAIYGAAFAHAAGAGAGGLLASVPALNRPLTPRAFASAYYFSGAIYYYDALATCAYPAFTSRRCGKL